MNQIQPEIIINNLDKSFGSTKALNKVSLRFTGPGPFGILGPDGAGKTTLMRVLAGVMSFRGQVRVLGNEYPGFSNRSKQHVGYMPQIFGLYRDLSVEENLIFFAELFGMTRNKIKEKLPGLLQFSNLTKFANRPAGNLSGGMKQKLALCSCLIHDPKLLILDEPGAGVDPVSRKEFWQILKGLVSEGIMVVVSTTYMDEAERCVRTVYLKDGKVIADGSVDAMLKNYPYTLFKLRSKEIRPLRDKLKNSGNFKNVNFFGDSVHVSSESSAREIKQLIDQSLIREFPDIEWEEINPDLEDVFVHLGEGGEFNAQK